MELESLQHHIHEVRGCKVMFDFDLAVLYEVETRVLNQAIKRNMENFPEDFMFRVTASEWEEISSSQIVMMKPSKNRTGKYLPYVFTEHGVAMLASVLKSQRARKLNIDIVRAFIALRKHALLQLEIAQQLHELKQRIGKHDIQLAHIYEAIESMLLRQEKGKNWEEREMVGFKK